MSAAMDAQLALQKCLHSRLVAIRARNPSFSLRAFAKKLDVSPSALSEILRGRRKASADLAKKISTRLHLDPEETHQLLKNFVVDAEAAKPSSATVEQEEDYRRLTADQFHLMSEWTHYAILSLMQTDGFKSKPGWIAERLGVPVTQAERSIERLLRLELIEKIPGGRLRRTHAKIHTPDDVFNLSLQKAHIADMEIAKEALQNLPVELRDFTSITVPTDPALLPELKLKIRRFREEMATFLEAAPKRSEVYQMSLYVFPLTRFHPSKNSSQEKDHV